MHTENSTCDRTPHEMLKLSQNTPELTTTYKSENAAYTDCVNGKDQRRWIILFLLSTYQRNASSGKLQQSTINQQYQTVRYGTRVDTPYAYNRHTPHQITAIKRNLADLWNVGLSGKWQTLPVIREPAKGTATLTTCQPQLCTMRRSCAMSSAITLPRCLTKSRTQMSFASFHCSDVSSITKCTDMVHVRWKSGWR